MSNTDPLAPPKDYLQTYSLSCEPFANDVDGRFFYGGSALMQRLDLLSHLTRFGDSVVLVSGPPGSGKTTMLSRFVAQTGKPWRLCLLNAGEFEQFEPRLGDTLRIAEAIGAQAMLERWASETDNAQLLVIVIDDAERLSEDAFATLCALLNQPVSERVRLVLFGTPEAQQTLKRALEQKSLSCTSQLLEVPRLSEEETASYLMYRLAVAGYSGESPFTPTEVRGICKAGDGRPGLINRLAHDSLLERQARAKSKPLKRSGGTRKPGAIFWGPASVLVLGAAVYLGWERLTPPPNAVTDTAERAQALTERPLALPAPAPETPREATTASLGRVPASPPPATAQDPATPLRPSTPTAALPLPPAADLPATDPAPQAAASHPPATPATPQASTATPVPAMPEKPHAAPETAPIATPAQNSAPDQVQPPAAEQPAAAAVSAAAAGSRAQPGTTPVPAAKADQPATATPTPAQTPPANDTPSPHREDWLLTQPGDRFTLQLLGSRSESSLQSFIARHKLDVDEAAYYRGLHQGTAWYVLIYGSYPDKASALAARDKLPAPIRSGKPWPRSLESVQTAIRDAQ